MCVIICVLVFVSANISQNIHIRIHIHPFIVAQIYLYLSKTWNLNKFLFIFANKCQPKYSWIHICKKKCKPKYICILIMPENHLCHTLWKSNAKECWVHTVCRTTASTPSLLVRSKNNYEIENIYQNGLPNQITNYSLFMINYVRWRVFVRSSKTSTRDFL